MNSATISWGASTDDVALSSYSVYWIYRTGHSGRGGGYTTHTILEATTNGSTTSATISGLAANQSYTLYVKATDVKGFSSGYAGPVVATPGARPYGLTAVAVGSAPYSPIAVVANHALTVQLGASSPIPITYSILSPPAGMSVNATRGLVTWTPTASNVGTTNVVFRATNQFGTTSLTAPITVSADVPIPGFTFNNLASPTFSVVGLPIGLQITDGSKTPSTFSVVSAPANVSINPATGVVNWIPTPAQAGNSTLTFRLTNGAGTATITVNPVVYIADAPRNVAVSGVTTLTPTLSWAPPVYDALVAGYRVLITGSDYSNFTITTGVSPLSFPLNLGTSPATYQVDIQALDAKGAQGLWNSSLSFQYAPDLPKPTFAFTSNGGAAYAVAGQAATIQVTDLNATLPDTFTLLAGPNGMTVDRNTGLVSWTPALSDLGYASATISVTNAVGTSYVSPAIDVFFASTVDNVTAAIGQSGDTVDVSWSAPTVAGEPIAGYEIYLSGRGDEGNYYNTSAFAPAGSTSFTLRNVPQGFTYTIYIVAVDASGRQGAFPDAGTSVGGG